MSDEYSNDEIAPKRVASNRPKPPPGPMADRPANQPEVSAIDLPPGIDPSPVPVLEMGEAAAGPGLGAHVRVPFGTRSQKLHFPKREGYKRRIFNDTPGRLEAALQAGYTFVMTPGRTHISRAVGTAERGGKQTGYLMEIPQQFYDEDFAAKQASLDVVDRQILKGTFNEERDDKRYVPNSVGITARRNTRPA